ncbi:MAG: phosphoglycerate kinase [Candidatus Woesearchaeota archaeon]
MIKTIYDADLKGKKVLLNVDFNVPIDDNGDILDDLRIKEALTSINYILKSGCRQLIILSHLGRPDGKAVPKLRLDKVAARLMFLLGKDVFKLDDCVDVEIPEDKQVVLLENVRFHKEEEQNDMEFAKKLASHAELYVDDAFANAHRVHASGVGVTKFLPSYAGALMMKEIKTLSLENIEHPFVAIMGGAKLETKLPMIQNLIQKVDHLLLGGAMIFTFFKAKGYEVGKSLSDGDLIMAKMLLNNEKLILPSDVVVASDKAADASLKTVKASEIPKDAMGLDIGRESIENFKSLLKDAKTVVWNGPLGYIEVEEFAKATKEIANFLAGLQGKTKVIVGGGDTADVIDNMGMHDKFYHVSTGGGASLMLLEGKKLPAVEALDK